MGNGRRGRLIDAANRMQVVELIKEAVKNGARLESACNEAGISYRTFHRWEDIAKEAGGWVDKRTTCKRPTPANKLTEFEEYQILEVVHKPEYSSLPPSQIVPILADEGRYIASESTFYRVLHKHNEQHHRGRSHKTGQKTVLEEKIIEIVRETPRTIDEIISSLKEDKEEVFDAITNLELEGKLKTISGCRLTEI